MKRFVAISILSAAVLAPSGASAGIRFTTSPGYTKGEAKPSFIRGGSDFGWRDMTWKRWGGKTARGKGNAYDRDYIEADQAYEVFT